MLTITPSVITFQRTKSGNPEPVLKGLSERHEKNGFSLKSRKTMLERLRNYMFSQKYELTATGIKERLVAQPYVFLTLTLPAKQVHSDIEIKSVCLDNMLNKLRYHLKGLSYIWKAESQEKDAIHFHLIMNKRIEMKLCDKLWHDSIELLGYVTTFEKKHGHRNPPTNRIETVFSNRAVMGYATKYVAKVDCYRPIVGMCWGCSKDIQTDIRGSVTMSKKDEDKVRALLTELKIFSIHNEYCDKFYLDTTKDIESLPFKLRNVYKETIQYYLGRQICLEGMERIEKLSHTIQLQEYSKRRKLEIQGLTQFPESLFGNVPDKKKSKPKVAQRRKHNNPI